MRKENTVSVKTTMIATLASSAVLFSSLAAAELTGNVGATSDYLWRGVTQTNHQSAVSGGGDYAHASGAYAGTWVSNVADDTEIDAYVGFSGEAAGLSYDVGYIKYHYPNVLEDFNETYIGLGYGMFGLTYAVDSDNDNSYASISVDTEVKALAVNVTAGSYSFDNADDDYMHYGASVSKSVDGGWDATFAVSATDIKDDNPVATIGIAKEFNLL
jgi:uncharacterized protein (TIGR02001 family)